MKTKALSIALIALFSSQANAGRNMDWLLSAELDFGGDSIAGVTFTNSDTKTIKAGQLLHVAGGVSFDTLPNKKTWQTQVTIGYKFDDAPARNGDMSFSRIPLELIQFIKKENGILSPWRIGAGITYHLSPSLSSSGAANVPDLTFDNALGYIFEIDYQVVTNNFVGVRATSIDYTFNTATIKGNSIGILWSSHF